MRCSEQFASYHLDIKQMARREGFEPTTPRFVVWCSIQLSYRRVGLQDVDGPSCKAGKLLVGCGGDCKALSARPIRVLRGFSSPGYSHISAYRMKPSSGLCHQSKFNAMPAKAGTHDTGQQSCRSYSRCRGARLRGRDVESGAKGCGLNALEARRPEPFRPRLAPERAALP